MRHMLAVSYQKRFIFDGHSKGRAAAAVVVVLLFPSLIPSPAGHSDATPPPLQS